MSFDRLRMSGVRTVVVVSPTAGGLRKVVFARYFPCPGLPTGRVSGRAARQHGALWLTLGSNGHAGEKEADVGSYEPGYAILGLTGLAVYDRLGWFTSGRRVRMIANTCRAMIARAFCRLSSGLVSLSSARGGRMHGLRIKYGVTCQRRAGCYLRIFPPKADLRQDWGGVRPC